MKLKDIKVGTEYLIGTKNSRWPGHARVRVVKVGVHGINYGGYSWRASASSRAGYVEVTTLSGQYSQHTSPVWDESKKAPCGTQGAPNPSRPCILPQKFISTWDEHVADEVATKAHLQKIQRARELESAEREERIGALLDYTAKHDAAAALKAIIGTIADRDKVETILGRLSTGRTISNFNL